MCLANYKSRYALGLDKLSPNVNYEVRLHFDIQP